MSKLYFMAGLNAMICMSIVAICVCRLNLMRGGVRLHVRGQYSLYVGAAVFSAAQPWAGYWPGWAALAMAVVLLFGLWADSGSWREPGAITARLKERKMFPAKQRLVIGWRNLWRAWSVQAAACGLVLPDLLQLIADSSDDPKWFDASWKPFIRMGCLIAVIFLRPLRQSVPVTPEENQNDTK